MEADTRGTDENLTPSNNEDEMVKFSKVATVAKLWMVDFYFITLCRFFKEGELKKFNKTLSILDAITGNVSRVAPDPLKRRIAGFLARIMHGKLLDVSFDQDKLYLTPLMSAINIWSSLKDTVAEERVFESMSNLLYVQSVAVCLEKGNSTKATQVLSWLDEECEIPQNMLIKLSTIVKKGETYHPFLLNFSFVRLLESIQDFLETFLEQNPSDFLLMEATKVARSCPDQWEDSGSEEDCETEEDETLSDSTRESTQNSNESEKTTVPTRPKKKLLSTINVLPWKPESVKKSVVSLNRIHNIDGALPRFQGASPSATLKPTAEKRQRKKWLSSEDQQLKAGVKRHGEGKWSRILLDYDFPGRTGVMLKDRWRLLKRSHKV